MEKWDLVVVIVGVVHLKYEVRSKEGKSELQIIGVSYYEYYLYIVHNNHTIPYSIILAIIFSRAIHNNMSILRKYVKKSLLFSFIVEGEQDISVCNSKTRIDRLSWN